MTDLLIGTLTQGLVYALISFGVWTFLTWVWTAPSLWGPPSPPCC